MNRNPMTTLIESLFRNYPYMKLHQRLVVLTSLVQAINPSDKALREAVELIPKALELEITVSSIEELYRRGEIPGIDLPEEAKKLYEIEIKLLRTIFSFYIKPKKQGVEKYL